MRAAPITDADYRRMVDTVGDYAIFMLDAGGHIQTWNRGAQLLKGYAPDEIIGRHFSIFYPAEQVAVEWPRQELELAVRLGRFEDEGWRLRKDGSRFWANVVITTLRDDDGAVRGFVKVTRDLTERRQQEDLLRQSEERFRLMVDSVRDYAIFMLDPDGRIASWNLGAQLTKGYTAEEIIGEHFSIFYPQERIDERWPERELECALRDGRFEDEGWRLRKDGTRFWANVVITPLYDSHGQHRGFAKITRNLTERQRINRLEGESRQLTQFLAVLGHELRNPLAPIANAVAVMQLEEPPSPRLRQARDILARQVGVLRRLVDDLLDVGRIASGKIHIQAEPVQLQQVVADAREAVTALLRDRGHAFEADIPEAPIWVRGDHIRLVQVLTNLLHNAAKFTPEGGRIRLRLSAHDGEAELSVADNGPGIPPDRLDYVFRLFAQAEQDAAARRHGGLGVGLGLVHKLVSDHGGTVSAFSTGVAGEGVEFVVRLPLAEAL